MDCSFPSCLQLRLAPSDCHQFGPVKGALRESYFADEKELKPIFLDVLQMTDTLWKSSLVTAKDV
jgi:hypothetical protein